VNADNKNRRTERQIGVHRQFHGFASGDGTNVLAGALS